MKAGNVHFPRFFRKKPPNRHSGPRIVKKNASDRRIFGKKIRF